MFQTLTKEYAEPLNKQNSWKGTIMTIQIQIKA